MTIKNSAGNPRLTTIYLATFKVTNSAGKNDLRTVLTITTISASPRSHEPNLACFYNGRSSFMHFPPCFRPAESTGKPELLDDNVIHLTTAAKKGHKIRCNPFNNLIA